MRIIAKDDNYDCWSKGDEFEVKADTNGLAIITCHAGLSPAHYLLDEDDKFIHISDIEACPDFEVIHA